MLKLSELQDHWQEKRPYLTKKNYIQLCLQLEYGQYCEQILEENFNPTVFAYKYSIIKDEPKSGFRELIISRGDVLIAIGTLLNKELIRNPAFKEQLIGCQLQLSCEPVLPPKGSGIQGEIFQMEEV